MPMWCCFTKDGIALGRCRIRGGVPYATPPPQAPWARRISSFVARHSLLLQSFVIRAQMRKQKPPMAQWSVDPYQDAFASDVKALVQSAQSHGQRPVLILYPALYYRGMSNAEAQRFSALLWDATGYRPEMLAELDRKHAALGQVALSTGSLVIDGQAAFSGVRGAERRALFLDSEHLSAAGCNKLAGTLCERLTLGPGALIVQGQARKKPDNEHPEQYFGESQQGGSGFAQTHQGHRSEEHT